MDLFPDEAHVRLRNRVHGTYLHADEDGAGVSLRPHGRVPSRNAVWRVRRVLIYRNTFLLLQSTAYASYLVVSSDLAPPGYAGRDGPGGRRAVLRDYDADSQESNSEFPDDIAWRAVRADVEGDQTYVILRNLWRSLRANGKHRIWHTGVTVNCNSSDACSTPMMAHWTVEITPLPAPNSSLPEKNTGFPYLPASKEKMVKIETQYAPIEKDILSSQTKLSGEVGSDVGTIACTVSDIMLQRSHTCLGCSKESRNCLCDKCTRPAPSSSLPEENNTGFPYLPASKEKMVKVEAQWAPVEKDCLSSPTKLSGEVGSDVGAIACTLSRSHTCLGCSKESRNCLCDKCTRRMKIALLKARGASLGTGSFSFCLKCSDLVQGDHGGGGHNSDCIPLHTFDGSQVAWVTKKERWCAIFEGIQSDMHWNKFLGRPFLLHKPQGRRCEVCADHLTDDKLYGTLIQFCTIECWAYKAEEAAEFGWLGALMHADFDTPGEHCFCIVCRRVFVDEDDPEHLHDQKIEALRVITEFVGGIAATKVEIPAKHFMTNYWKCIKDLAGGETVSSPNHLFRLWDEGAQRCKGCKLRLEDGGGQVCSLECSLRDPMMLPRQVLRSPIFDAA